MASGLQFVVLLLSSGLLQLTSAADDDMCHDAIQVGNRCFTVHLQQDTWRSALQSCLSQNATLSSLGSLEEYSALISAIKNSFPGVDSVWIGGFKAKLESKWQWADGMEFNPKLWLAGQQCRDPGLLCMEMPINESRDEAFKAVSCDALKAYLCMRHDSRHSQQ
ncbi:type-2 ice-structuring protein-like [Chaetodon auriga]|uniref:type-2 ice-structuring protein-like n=1 Tax=Chaetodon auriga TaxID=39042 RepID=UPI0040330493